MRSLAIEKRTVWVSSYESKEQVVDEDGLLTGEWSIGRSAPFEVECTLSPNGGNVYADGFGYGVSYDRTLIAYATGVGIDEESVVWVDSVPELNADGSLKVDANGDPTVPFDYTVSSVAESLHVTNIALKKVL